MEIFAKEADGRLSKGPLYEILRKTFQFNKDFDLITLVTEDWNQGRTEMASLSQLLYKAYQAGDPYAQEAFEKAGREGALAVQAVANQLNFSSNKPIAVSYTGGVFRAGDVVLKSFREHLGPKYRLKKPLMEPVEGAALLACLYSNKSGKGSIRKQCRE